MNMKRKPVIAGIAAAAVLCAALSAQGQNADPYVWPAYSPNISYNMKDYPPIPMPAKDNIPTGSSYNIQGYKSGKWWTFIWGPRANSLLTTNNNRIVRDEIIDPLLARMDDEFTYFSEVMGWPRDRLVQNGFRSQVWLYGSNANSGLGTDSTATGGWQSSTNGYPIVLISYVPVLAFHPASYNAAGLTSYGSAASQASAVVHEGIHAVLASMRTPDGQETGRNIPGWFHEGGNTWLQKEADARRTGRYDSWADLDGTGYMAPFMPIECYSGWLQDGTFGGPNAEGVNASNSAGQICTWRRWLGGNQYGNGFPTFIGHWLGQGSVPWIWMNATNSNQRVLETMAKGLGEEQIRRLIMEYRAKQATLDLGKWTNAARNLLRGSHFGQSIGTECTSNNWSQVNGVTLQPWVATMYQTTTNNNGVLTPEERTLPGWSGANQIPLTVPTSLGTVEVELMPDSANMTLQIVYRATDGSAVYSQPVYGAGTARLRLDKPPANNVVIAVVTNTNYRFYNNNVRTFKYPYKLRISGGVTTAATNQKWFDLNNMVIDSLGHTGGTSGAADRNMNRGAKPLNASALKVMTNKNGTLRINYSVASPAAVSFDIYSTTGKLAKSVHAGHKAAGGHTSDFNLRAMGLATGTYVVKQRNAPNTASKVFAFVK